MIPPIICAFIFEEWNPFVRYLTAIGFALVIGSLMRFACINPERLSRSQAIAVTGLAWIVLGILCAVPLYYSGHFQNFMDALFDSVSGLTTTGATVIIDLDHLSNADNMMRSCMHLSGGLGLIVVALSLGLFGKGTGIALFTSEGRSEHVLPNVVLATRFFTKITAIIVSFSTLILFLLMIADGLEPSRAFLHGLWISVTAYVTGGHAPMSESVMYYNSMSIEFVTMIVMLLGAIGFTLYYWVFKGKTEYFFKDLEIKTGLIWVSVLAIIFTCAMASSPHLDSLPALIRRGAFTIVSAFSTTGLGVVTQSQIHTAFTSGAFVILAFAMAVGGSAGSTAGGIKFDRIGIIAKSIVLTIKQVISPGSAKVTMSYYHSGKKILDSTTVKNAMTIFILYVITFMLGTFAGIAHGYDASMSMYESMTLGSNAGLTCGIATSGMPWSLEIIYIIMMWAGRLEFLALLSLLAQVIVSLNPKYYKRKHNKKQKAQS